LNAHDGGKGHGALVQGLEQIHQDHDDEDALVNHLAQAGALLLGDLDARVAGVLGQLLVDLVIVGVAGLLELVDVRSRLVGFPGRLERFSDLAGGGHGDGLDHVWVWDL
jgi:hypothetical protein